MKSIGSRIIFSFGLLLLIVCVAFGTVSYFASSKSLIRVLGDTMPKYAMEASLTIRDSIQNHLNILSYMASSEEMRVLQDPNGDYSKAVAMLSKEKQRLGHESMLLINKNGIAVTDEGKILDMKEHQLFKAAMAGESTVSDPMFNEDRTKIVMAYAVPVVIDGEVSGVLMAVRDGMELSEFAQKIKFGDTGEAFIINKQGRTIAHADTELLKEIIDTRTVDASTTASVLLPARKGLLTAGNGSGTSEQNVDSVTSATPENADGGNNLGFDNFNEVQRKMMNGETGFEEYKYKGVAKVVGFAPISEYGWSVGVAVDKSEMMAEVDNLRTTFIVISVIILAAGAVTAFLIGKSISKPITELTNCCITMSKGDFTVSVKEKYAKRRDEIGDLARGFRKITEDVSKIIKNVISEANNVDNAIITASDSMSELTDQINVMSSITQELSAKMEETSAMAEEMNATATEIEKAIDSIANKAQEGAMSANEVSRRANELMDNAMNSQKSALELFTNNATKLREAIEKARAVERIGILSDAILEIAQRTNLLALNASIEAAQAGDAGRGFAVVAGEIRNLAENSRKTVSEIQQVTKQVVESVYNLSECSEKVLDFLENKVVKDYDMLVETGEKYNNDARMIDEMVADFSATSEELYSSVHSIMKAINDVAEAATEGSAETTDMANEAGIVATKASEVMEQAKKVKESTEKLLNVVSMFRV
ncbi:chemotaxis protein [Thermoclostridium stercorarium subsp. thermolacticum DSM 2910]|uniref:Chemotaxis protein n=1 Tax=Thermoclostridium stercorarium subsp. thermolacticum DSM 2910 TaxID=1121336 RepID=A0A1B1YE14_THEST|nr:methyl-accepting chemotaxis protein [Thermoclostridium stercorarium]ANW99009.1 chemotaxis protein [Thermoclostridium stercorarium subsp. thermolacticum DSM 2910]UZQ84654.1 methyl-accepting chemotaxis protein [Thermoclostridium stercorarium]